MNSQKEARSSRNGLLGLFMSLIEDVQTMFRQELRRMRDEFHVETSKACQAAISMGIAIVLVLLGGVFALFMIGEMLHDLAGLPLWASYGTIGGVIIAVGSVLLFRGTRAIQEVNLIPRRSIHSIRDNAQWIKDQVLSNKT